MKFNPDAPLMRFLTRLADLMILNLAFLVCCIPIVTIGPALTALYYITLKMTDDEHSAILRDFFRSFRQNFRQSLICWLGCLALIALFFLDAWLLLNMGGMALAVLGTLLLILAALALMAGIYLFAFLAKFETTVKAAVKNSLLLTVAYLPKSLLMGATVAAPIAATFSGDVVFAIGLAFWPMMGFAVLALANSCLLRGIFNKAVSGMKPDDDNSKHPTTHE